jgi:Lipocalin-like domain
MKKYILFIIIIVLVGTSCVKQKIQANATCDLLNTTNLVGTYQIIGVKLKQSSTSPYIDAYNTPSVFAQCRKDDLLTLNTNGTFINNDGVIICNPANHNASGTWTLSGNTFKTTGNYNAEEFTIENYTCTNMDLKISYQIVNATATILYNLQKQ